MIPAEALGKIVNDKPITEECLYRECVARGIETGNHESDLYIPATAETRQLCSLFGLKTNTFINQAPPHVGEIWLDVPFAYIPWWVARIKGTPESELRALTDQTPIRGRT